MVLADPIYNRSVYVEDAIVEKLPIGKGHSSIIDHSSLKSLLPKYFENSEVELSGSSINVVKGLAKLGNRCVIIGTIGTDFLGARVCTDLKEQNIDFVHNVENYPTSQTLVFVTPDKERTMLTYIGASKFLSTNLLREKDFEKLKFFHLEGYQIRNYQVAKEALSLAKKNHAIISIDLACAYLAKEFKQQFLELIKKYADIVFCNELEAKEIIKADSLEQTCEELAKLCDIAIVTRSEKGGIVSSRGKTFHYKAKKILPKDTTGA